uniref:Uncharacterized protein n=1 Tax=Helianthus annuus TaxID=4232 RepID=A0A251UKC9_HELAN
MFGINILSCDHNTYTNLGINLVAVHPTRKKLRRQNKNIQNRKQETKERLQQIRNIKRFPIIPNRRLQLRANTNPQKGSLINSTVL